MVRLMYVSENDYRVYILLINLFLLVAVYYIYCTVNCKMV